MSKALFLNLVSGTKMIEIAKKHEAQGILNSVYPVY